MYKFLHTCTCILYIIIIYMYSTYQMQLKRQTRFTRSGNACVINSNAFVVNVVKCARVGVHACLCVYAFSTHVNVHASMAI